MTENSDKEGSEAKADKPKRQAKSGSRNVISYLALVLAIAASSGLAWLVWVDYQQASASAGTDALQARIVELDKRLSEQQGQLQAAVTQLQSELGDLSGSGQAIEALGSELDSFAQRTQALESQFERITSTDRADWKLAEAEYLLRLANHRLRLAGETAGAMSLLGSADDILHQLDEPALLVVREEIAKELVQLRAMAKRDVQGVYLRLAALSELVWTLPLAVEPILETADAEGGPEEVPASAWRVRLASLLEILGTYFVVQRLDYAPEPMASPEQQHDLREELSLGLEQAQSALLTARSEVYESALRKTMSLLKAHFDLDDQRVRTMTAELGVLQAYDAAPEMPDIGASLSLLRETIAIRHNSGPANAAPEVE